MFVPVVIHKDRNSDYGVTVPDLPGCFSAGESIEAALAHAREAIELHLEGLLEHGEPLPEATPIEQLRRRRAYRGGVWFMIDVDPSKLRGPAARVNITLPERLLAQIDRAAAAENTSRSGFLASAALARITGTPRG
jgi:predicted RNase H-like HicB family nuclease